MQICIHDDSARAPAAHRGLRGRGGRSGALPIRQGLSLSPSIRLPGKGNSSSHGARPVHLDDEKDSDQ